MNSTKIVNCTVQLFWFRSIGVPSTAKGTKRAVRLNSQNLARMLWLHLYSFSKDILGFLMTTEHQDLGLTSHPKHGKLSMRYNLFCVYFTGIRVLMNLLFIPGHIILTEHKV